MRYDNDDDDYYRDVWDEYDVRNVYSDYDALEHEMYDLKKIKVIHVVHGVYGVDEVDDKVVRVAYYECALNIVRRVNTVTELYKGHVYTMYCSKMTNIVYMTYMS